MQLIKYGFNKKCNFDMCQQPAEYSLSVGAKGELLMCTSCLTKLKKILKLKNGEG